MKAQAWSLRKNFLDDLIGKADGNKKKRLIEIKKREEMSLQWRIWKAVTGGNKGEAVTAVEYKKREHCESGHKGRSGGRNNEMSYKKIFPDQSVYIYVENVYNENWISSGKAGRRDGVKWRYSE